MKRFVNFFLIVLFFLVVMVVVLPVAFKGKIRDAALQEVNRTVDAEVGFDRFSVSLIKSFPDLSASFTNFYVKGKDGFAQDTLVAVDAFNARVNLISLFGKEPNIESIKVDHPKIKLINNVDKQGNWNIIKTDGAKSESKERSGSSSNFSFNLDEIVINDFELIYDDHFFDMIYHMSDGDFTMNGELKGLETILEVDAMIGCINLEMDSMQYLDSVELSMSSTLVANMEEMEFKLQENQSFINDLPIEVEGGISLPDNKMNFDLSFSSPDVTLKELLQFVPSAFQSYFKDVTTDGQLSLNGHFAGLMSGKIWPALSIDLNMENGMIQYPKLPESIHGIRLHTQIYKPEGVLDLLSIKVTNLDANLGENPIRSNAYVESLFSDPYLKLEGEGNVDLSTLKDIIPINDLNMAGTIDGDIWLDGHYSAIKDENFDEFIAKGAIKMNGFTAQSLMFREGLVISNAALVLDGQTVEVKNFKGRTGRSDFAFTGKIDRLMSWLVGQEELTGKMNFYSHYMDLNPLMHGTKKQVSPGSGSSTKDSTEQAVSIIIPNKIWINFDSKIDKLHVDNMDVTNFKGGVEMRNQKLTLKNTSMGMLDGKLGLNGYLVSNGKDQPNFEFDVKVQRFDLPTAYKEISVVRKFLPFAAKSVGRFSSSLKMRSEFDDDFKIQLGALNAAGSFSTHGVKVMDSGFYSQLKSVVKTEKLKNITVKDFIAKFTINDGNISFKPFNTAIASQPTSLSGTYNMGGNIDFRIDSNVDKSLLSNQIVSMVNMIPGGSRIKKIDVGMNITGKAKKPEVKLDTDKLRKQVMKQIQNSSPKELEDAAKDLLKMFLK